MKIFALSDLHLSINFPKPMNIFGPTWDNYIDKVKVNWQALVKPEDIVVISGDISWAMYLEDAKADLKYINKLNGRKVILRGNHDYWWSTISGVREALPQNMYAVQNDCIQIDNVLFFGSRGWLMSEGINDTAENKKIYTREVLRLELSLKNMQVKREKLLEQGITPVEICMLHYPPFNILRADTPVTNLLEKYDVKNVVYGHLHGSSCMAEKVVEKNGIKYFLTSCDLVDNCPQLITEI